MNSRIYAMKGSPVRMVDSHYGEPAPPLWGPTRAEFLLAAIKVQREKRRKQKKTAGRSDRRQGRHVAADQIPVC